jgi:two-component system osmolarity sensor histidine kinase EnvZ
MSDLSEILEDVAAGARHGDAALEVAWKGDMNVELRPIAMKRCLTNIVSNAQRYASEIRIEAVRGRTAVEITVDDNGPGIPPENYEDVFRPFFRLDQSRNAATGGVGLGLSIAPRRGAQSRRRGHAGRLAAGRFARGRANSALSGAGGLAAAPPVID